jgi:hypothetical protein
MAMRAFLLGLCFFLWALLPTASVPATVTWLDGLDVRDPSAAGFVDSLVENYACSGQCPHLVVRPKTNEEVAAAIRYAQEAGKRLVVRGGGHGYTCQSTAAGAVMVDLRRFKFIRMVPRSEVRRPSALHDAPSLLLLLKKLVPSFVFRCWRWRWARAWCGPR